MDLFSSYLLQITVFTRVISVIYCVFQDYKSAPARTQEPGVLRGTRVSVQTLPDYQKAVSLFAKGDRPGARHCLERSTHSVPSRRWR
jgi:hypothetical protein